VSDLASMDVEKGVIETHWMFSRRALRW